LKSRKYRKDGSRLFFVENFTNSKSIDINEIISFSFLDKYVLSLEQAKPRMCKVD